MERYFDHEADIGIIGCGASIEAAFVNAAENMFGIMSDLSLIKKEKSKTTPTPKICETTGNFNICLSGTYKTAYCKNSQFATVKVVTPGNCNIGKYPTTGCAQETEWEIVCSLP